MNKHDYYHRLGQVTSIMMASDAYRKYPIACIAAWIKPPLLLGQHQIFYDLSGGIVGYVTWALLSEETERRWIHDPRVILHLSEWNEGDRLWIMDFVLLRGNISQIIAQSRPIFSGHTFAQSLRRNTDGSVRKVTNWQLFAAE